MKCLRCGWCCKHLAVIIVDDPDIGPVDESNLLVRPGNGTPCQHLTGDRPGECACAVHEREWYEETPCFAHTQIENSLDDPCRMGEYLLKSRARAVGE